MPERINKLQPDRTLSLRGFDSFAAAATIHSATPSGFTLSGTFRDPADFAVAVLYDADNFFEHPSVKYLPDFNFSGLTLAFNLNYSTGLQPIDSPKYNWIDWATLDCIRADGSTAQIRLWDNVMLSGSSYLAASATFEVITSGAGVQPFDRVTLWYQNLAFDYIVPGGLPHVQLQFFAAGAGTTHFITINGHTYPYTESNPTGESSQDVANGLLAAINTPGDPFVTAAIGILNYAVALSVNSASAGIDIQVTASDGNAPVALYQSTPALVAAQLVGEINSTSWIAANTPFAIQASAAGARIAINAARYGTANTSGTTVSWISGAKFSGIIPGSTLLLGAASYTVAGIQSPVQLTLSAAAPTSTGVNANGTSVVWVSGPQFGAILPGAAILIDGIYYTVASVPSPVLLTLSTPAPLYSGFLGSPYVAPRGGSDGNTIQLYSLSKTSTLSLDRNSIPLLGGSSAVSWNCTIDFTALGIDQLRQCWLTFAPALANASAYIATEWQAVFSNWQVTGAASALALQVAGPGSVRIEDRDTACAYTGTWNPESGFYSGYFAHGTTDPTATMTVEYTSQFTHDLYLGTSLYTDRATVGVTVDDNPEFSLNCYLNTVSAVVTRRLVRSSVAPGCHTIAIRITSPGAFYFDFLEAAVPADVPDALTPRTAISPALDFDTDHTYKLSPARLMWIMDKLGYAGPMNEYLGVFWWNERVLSGGTLSTALVSFSGTFAAGDTAVLILNGTSMGKTVFPADTLTTIAAHFADYINGAFVGAWASSLAGVLTITSRSPAPAYNLTVSITKTSSAGQAAVTTQPQPGTYGTWIIDDVTSAPLNRAARDWHADFYSQCASRHRPVVTACSMELVNPPDGYVARFPDLLHTAVSTDTGFGSLVSNHCAIGSSKMLAYQKKVYRFIAGLQATAGLTPSVQYGEFLWWYFAGPGGMAYYDDETLAAAQAALGRPLQVFQTPSDDPGINAGADATFLRNRLRDHVAALVADLHLAYPAARCEVLWPYDVNYPSFLPTALTGGALNHFVNLPVEWQTQAGSGLSAIKVEALAFGATARSLDLAKQAIDLFPAFGWPLNAVSYLVPVFGAATPWAKELALVWAAGLPAAHLWAFDHVCLFNLPVPEPALDRRSFATS